MASTAAEEELAGAGAGAGAPANDGPLPPALHRAAQVQDMAALHELLEGSSGTAADSKGASSGSPKPKADVNDADSQGITALHWAAINNHLVACRYLLEKGAEVDARGGELNATPIQWAARNGHVYVVHLLIKYGADPSLLDSQSFNTLHLAVHSSAALLVAYVLFTSLPLAVDSTDTEGHTSLHWACYQGDALSVDLLLKAGADARRADNAGLTPLHWAAVKGNATCIQKIAEAGGEAAMLIKDNAGKTAKDMSIELKSFRAYQKGLEEAGYLEDGRKSQASPFANNPRRLNQAIYLVPLLTLTLVFNTLATLPWWTAFLLVAAEGYAMHHVIARVLLDVVGARNKDKLGKSPYLNAIIVGSIVFVSYVWLTRYVTNTPGHEITNLLFAMALLTCIWNLFRAATLDPGFVPLPKGESEIKETIETLVEIGEFNGMSFCLTCMVRRPLRSKHSFGTKRCTARFDHHCPWVWNDVGVNNHRQFVLFVTTLVIGVVLFIRLAIAYFTANAPDVSEEVAASCFVGGPLCAVAQFDSFALAVTIWAGLQLTWTLILLGAQLWQIARQMTTLEVSNVGRYGFMGGLPGVSAAKQTGLIEKHNAAKAAAGEGGEEQAAQEGEEGHVHGPACRHGGPKKTGGVRHSNFLMKALGLDRFISGKAAEGLANSGKVTNPFDLGLIGNCVDFWQRGRGLGVDYTVLYEVPPGGFKKLVAERKRREKSEAGSRKSQAAVARGGYERLDMEDV